MASPDSSWDSLLLAFRAGQDEFRNTVEAILIPEHPHAWISFGHSIFRRIDNPRDPYSTNFPMMISLLKLYFTIVDHGTIRQNLSVPKTFFPWLADVISNTDRSIPLRGTAILVASMITQMLPQYVKSFGSIVGALRSELRRISQSHASDPHVESAVVVQPDEIIIHQLIEFLRNVQNIGKAKWMSDLATSLRDVHVILQHKDSFRPQCQVEITQILGRLFEIAAANPDRLELSAGELSSIAADIIRGVRRAKVVHDAFSEALYGAIDAAAAAHYWTEGTLLHCCSLCADEIRNQELNSVFDIKANESLLSLLGVAYEKYSLVEFPESSQDGNSSGPSELVMLNVELIMTCIRDLQEKLVLFLSDMRHNMADSTAEKKKGGEKFNDFRHACADVRNSAISTVILVTKAVPLWAERYPDLFWELSTGQLRTPLLFAHCLVEAVPFNAPMVQRIAVYLKAALAQIQKYVIKDACNLVASISDVVSSHHYSVYISTRPVDDLGIGLLHALQKAPKLPAKAASADESENTLSGWKLSCCNCIDNMLKTALQVQLSKGSGERIGEDIVLPGEFCGAFVRIVADIFITLHRACGLFGGPKGVTVADRARPARAEAEKFMGSSDFDALEPVLMALSGTILSFIDYVVLLPGSVPVWATELHRWREYDNMSPLSAFVVFLKYCMSSLSRPVRYENDVDLLCGDIDLVTRGLGLLCHWAGNAAAPPTEEFCILERSIGEISSKTVSVFSLFSDATGIFCQILGDIRNMEQSSLGDEAKCVLFDMTKDALQATEHTIFSLKKRSCGESDVSNERLIVIDDAHNQLASALSGERFDHTMVGAAAQSGPKFKHTFQSSFMRLIQA